MSRKDIVIVGGGPAGLAAARAAYDMGIKDILVIERDERLGGILNQCIHNGFGLHRFKEELTGPEYADRFVKLVNETGIECKTKSIVLSACEGKVTYMNSQEGIVCVDAGAVILAMGCRERPRGALNIPGFRPAGIYTAGTAQRLVNIEGQSVGRDVVILGSGDIGLIMARRMTLQGAKVHAVAELMPYSGGLKRNIVQCLEDYDIPLMLSHTVSKIYGKERVTAVDISKVDENRKVIPGTTTHIECDTLLLSCGLIPENELSTAAGVEINRVTNGPVVGDDLMTSVPGVFACGNVLHVHDLVDFVSDEAERAGRCAAAYVKNLTGDKIQKSNQVNIQTEGGIRYVVPQKVDIDSFEDGMKLRFRVGDVYRNKRLVFSVNGKEKKSLPKNIVEPGKMEEFTLSRKFFEGEDDITDLKISLEDAR